MADITQGGQVHKDKLLSRLTRLKTERSGWLKVYQDLSDFIQPYAGRFFVEDRNRGDRSLFNNIIDDTGTAALDILAAGLMGGLTSPARPWFRLSVGDKSLRDNHDVKLYLAECQQILLDVFAKSNTYLALHDIYYDLGLFGTACSILMDDFENVIHHYSVPVGEFCLASDFRGNTNTVYREFQKTVGEVVGEFGKENCSQHVQGLFARGEFDQWVTICHTIEPRVARDGSKQDAKNKPWRSVYFELTGEKTHVLRDSGFDAFRALTPRWHKKGGDIYGRSPGMRALGAVKQLQHEQIRKANAIDQMSKPSLQAPTSAKNLDIDMLPGGISFVDVPGGQSAIRNLMDVQLNLDHLHMDMVEVRQRIRSAFYSDLFLLITNSGDTQKTAAEIAERHEEKMLVLGPVLQRLESELLRPLIDMTFARCADAGLLPEPPEVLQGRPLDIEYTSILAQAQRLVGTNGIDRYVMALGGVAQFKPGVLDKFKEDEWADEYADMLGIPPNLIASDEEVAAVRDQRAKAQQQAAMAEQANMAADTASKLGGIPTDGNVASQIMQGLTGYN